MSRARRWGAALCIVAQGLLVLTPAFAETGAPPPEPAGALPPPVWLQNAADPPDSPVDLRPVPSRSYTFGILGSAAGMVAGVGLAVWVKRQADDRYEEYEITADRDRAAELFESAQRYDRATIIGWGLAQVSFVALLYFLTREQPRTLVPVEGEPLVRPRPDGVDLGFRFTP